jgi:hypothetical protein
MEKTWKPVTAGILSTLRCGCFTGWHRSYCQGGARNLGHDSAIDSDLVFLSPRIQAILVASVAQIGVTNDLHRV